MSEDLMGMVGKLGASFLGGEGKDLSDVAIEAVIEKFAEGNPQLAAGLKQMKALMGNEDFSTAVAGLKDMNFDGKSLMLLAQDQKVQSLLMNALPLIQKAFSTQDVKIEAEA